MSIKVMTLVWDGFPDSGSSLLCMLALADWCDDTGGSLFPSIAAVAEKIRTSSDQARRLMRDFERRGFLAVVGNEHGGRPGTTRHYRLNVPALRKLAVQAEAAKAAKAASRTAGADASPVTDCTDATPGAAVTPGMDATPRLAPVQGEGLHGCKGRAGAGASLTTKEPPRNHQGNRQERAARKKPAPAFCLPDWIDADAWKSYEAMRVRINKPMTDDARDLAVGKLDKLRAAGHAPRDVLEQSVFNSWQGLFAVKQEQPARPAPRGAAPADDTAARNAAVKEMLFGGKRDA